jgi:hypothetical protein
LAGVLEHRQVMHGDVRARDGYCSGL